MEWTGVHWARHIALCSGGRNQLMLKSLGRSNAWPVHINRQVIPNIAICWYRCSHTTFAHAVRLAIQPCPSPHSDISRIAGATRGCGMSSTDRELMHILPGQSRCGAGGAGCTGRATAADGEAAGIWLAGRPPLWARLSELNESALEAARAGGHKECIVLRSSKLR